MYLGVISIQMVGDIETGNYITEEGSVKGKKEGGYKFASVLRCVGLLYDIGNWSD